MFIIFIMFLISVIRFRFIKTIETCYCNVSDFDK